MGIVFTPEEIAAAVGHSESDSGSQKPSQADLEKFHSVFGYERITRGRLPAVEITAEHFARLLRNRLSTKIGRNCTIHPEAAQTIKFGEYTKSLQLPSSMHVFRMQPLPGEALLVIESPLFFSLVDASFGGEGRSGAGSAGREFTQIENRLIAKLVLSALDDFSQSWGNVTALQCSYVRSEQNPVAVNIASPSDSALLLKFAVDWENGGGALSVCIPWRMLSRVKEKLASDAVSGQSANDAGSDERMRRNLNAVHVELRAVLGEGTMKVRDVLKLNVGDVIPLATNSDEPASIRINGTEKLKGQVGISNGRKSVKISS